MRWRLVILAVLSIVVPAFAVAPTTNPTPSVEREAIRHGDANQKAPTTQESSVANHAMPTSPFDMQRVAMSLLIVIGVIIAARFAMKKLFPAVAVGRNSQVIRVLSRSVVGPKQQFLLVQIGKRLVLVGDSGASMNALSEIHDPEEVAALVGKLQSESHHSATSAFTSFFKKADSEFKIHSESALAERSEIDTVETESPQETKGELDAASSEISGLMDQVRGLTKKLRQT